MELTNDFVIERGIEETWNILNDLEFIAPCMPGAQLTEIEGDEYRGLVKIKVGPITANYKGKASFVEQDAANHVAKLKAEGRDPRQGNANAMVTATMEELAAEQTKVTIHTDLGLSGKIASFGRGAIEDVSKKLLGQFIDNLRDKLAADTSPTGTGSDSAAGAATAAATSAGTQAPDASSLAPTSTGTSGEMSPDASASSPASTADQAGTDASIASSGIGDASSRVTSAATSSASATSASATSDGAASGVRKIDSPEAQAVDLLDVAGGAAAKRVVPAVGGLAVLAAIIWWVVSR